MRGRESVAGFVRIWTEVRANLAVHPKSDDFGYAELASTFDRHAIQACRSRTFIFRLGDLADGVDRVLVRRRSSCRASATNRWRDPADLPARVIELASRSGSTRNRWILARLVNRYDEWIMPNQQASEDKSDGFNLTRRAKSFYDAGRGLYRMFVSQHNAWIHAVATIAVVIMGLAMDVARVDWCWLVLCIFGVWTAEALNTALECLADVASPEYHPLVRDAKDIAAGAVLISAIAAAIIGAIVFWPYWMA